MEINKYNNSKIYAIRSLKGKEIYIGSTYEPLSKRFSRHKSDYIRYINSKYSYCSSFDLFFKYDIEDCYIELIENVNCSCKEELRKKEGEYIRKMDCLNRYIPGN